MRWRTKPAILLVKIPTATKSAPPVRTGAGWREDGTGRSSVNVFVCRRLAERAARFLHEKRLDEHVEVAVEHAVDVADLLFGPVIFGELIRMEDVAPNLAAERDLLLRAPDLIELRLVLLELDVVEPRFQDAHRRIAVAMLRPFVLTRDHEAGRQVGNADGRIGDVDVLTTCTARPEGIDPNVLVVNHDIDVFRQFGPDIERRERRMPPRRLIERRNAHEAMD